MSEKAVPELSIIVPVYKVEKYLPKCIDSILAQTFTDFELILIDDGSPDRCGEICDEYAAKDRRIVAIHQENQGVSAARNAGLDIAKGKYIGFVDSDDWIEPEMYDNMLKAASDYLADIVLCGFQYFNGKETVFNCGGGIPHDVPVTSEQLLTYSLGITQKFYFGAVWNKLFRANLLQGTRFHSELSLFEDWLFDIDVLRENHCTTVVLPEAFYHYRTEENSGLSKTVDPMRIRKSLLQFYEQIPSFMQQTAAVIRFLDDAASYLPRIKKGPHSVASRLSIKFHVALILFQARRRHLISTTEFHKYIYEGLLHS